MPLFEKREPYSKNQVTVYPPKSLVDRIAVIQETEDIRGLATVWVGLASSGAELWEWMHANSDVLDNIKDKLDLTDAQLAIALLEVGLEIYRKDPKTWRVFAFQNQAPQKP